MTDAKLRCADDNMKTAHQGIVTEERRRNPVKSKNVKLSCRFHKLRMRHNEIKKNRRWANIENIWTLRYCILLIGTLYWWVQGAFTIKVQRFSYTLLYSPYLIVIE